MKKQFFIIITLSLLLTGCALTQTKNTNISGNAVGGLNKEW